MATRIEKLIDVALAIYLQAEKPFMVPALEVIQRSARNAHRLIQECEKQQAGSVTWPSEPERDVEPR